MWKYFRLKMVIRPKHVAVSTEENIQNSGALGGNPEPDLVQATGCKQPTLRLILKFVNQFQFGFKSDNNMDASHEDLRAPMDSSRYTFSRAKIVSKEIKMKET
jgi:hypothetical protein